MTQSTGEVSDAMAGSVGRGGSEPLAKKPKKEEAFSQDLSGVKFNKDGMANKNFLFSSVTPRYKVQLFRGRTEISQIGKHLIYPGVWVEFENGLFVLDNKFREKYYRDKRDGDKLNDFKILQRLRHPACGYMRDYFFVKAIDNKEAEKMRSLADDIDTADEVANDPLANIMKAAKPEK